MEESQCLLRNICTKHFTQIVHLILTANGKVRVTFPDKETGKCKFLVQVRSGDKWHSQHLNPCLSDSFHCITWNLILRKVKRFEKSMKHFLIEIQSFSPKMLEILAVYLVEV